MNEIQKPFYPEFTHIISLDNYSINIASQVAVILGKPMVSLETIINSDKLNNASVILFKNSIKHIDDYEKIAQLNVRKVIDIITLINEWEVDSTANFAKMKKYYSITPILSEKSIDFYLRLKKLNFAYLLMLID